MHVNVLVVGETQQGKSTLISRIGNYAKANVAEIRIGDGHISCTSVVGFYPISAAPQSYCLRDATGHKIHGRSFSDMIEITLDEANVTPEEAEADAEVEYLFVDTPGLDDSAADDHSKDMDTMASIMGRIGELESLNAIIYVRGVDKPLGNTFRSFFKYLQESIPSLCNAVIVVHTKYTIDKVESAMDRGEDLADQRRYDFRRATRLDLQHIFMDNVPDLDCPFAEMQSLNQCTQLLRLLANQRPLSATGFRLLKTPNMINVDNRIVVDLLDLKARLNDQWSAAVAKADDSQRVQFVAVRKTQRIKREIEKSKTELDALDTDDLVNLGQRAVSKDFSFVKNAVFRGELWLDDKRVEFHSECEITQVDKTTKGAAEWKQEQRAGGHWSAKMSAPLMRSLSGTATFYTTNRLKHEKQIQLLKRELKHRQQDLADEEDMQTALELSNGRRVGASVADLAAKVESCAALVDKVRERDLNLSLWPKLKKFYADTSMLGNNTNLKEFVLVYDAVLADAV